MTLHQAQELLLIELAQLIDNKNKKIDELSTENSMLRYSKEQLQYSLDEAVGRSGTQQA